MNPALAYDPALVDAAGVARVLVGRTGFCVHPRPTVRAITKVGGTKSVRLERIRELAPTHVVVNVDENEKGTVDRIAQFVPHVVVTYPLNPRDNVALYRLLGGIFRRETEARSLIARFEEAWREATREASAFRRENVLWIGNSNPPFCQAGRYHNVDERSHTRVVADNVRCGRLLGAAGQPSEGYCRGAVAVRASAKPSAAIGAAREAVSDTQAAWNRSSRRAGAPARVAAPGLASPDGRGFAPSPADLRWRR